MIFRQPAEWEPHAACWTAWPCHADLWKENLQPTQDAFVHMCRAIADPDPLTSITQGERLNILVMPHAMKEAAHRLGDLEPLFYDKIPYGDIWLRDTGPIFTRPHHEHQQHALFPYRVHRFGFNGWGGKYILPHDRQAAGRITRAWQALAPRGDSLILKHPFVFEGGSVDVDGYGTGLTTRQCLLNKNRHPHLTAPMAEKNLREALGIEKTLWITRGLVNDHTDGHVDNIARFIAPGVVVCMEPRSSRDPNRDVLREIIREVKSFRDIHDQRLTIIPIPSPGRVEDPDGNVMPASYLNFYISNRAVVMPMYGTRYDDEAADILSTCFPEREIVSINARSLLSGGGAFHCITQQEPK